MSPRRFDWTGLVARLLFSLWIVFAVYNPSGYSYWHWLWQPGAFWLKLAAGAALALAHLLLWRSVFAVLRVWGVLLLATIGGAGYAALGTAGVIDHMDAEVLLVGILAGLSGLMALGLSTALVMHRLTGVQHTEEVTH